MKYYFAKASKRSFDGTIAHVTELLKSEGFGILTEIDVKETLKKKLDVDFRRYKILGACNPPIAHRVLQAEEHIGLLLPCSVVVQEKESGVEVSAIDPVASMAAVENDALLDSAEEVRRRMQKVIEQV